MSVVDVLGSVDELADGIGGSVDAVTGAAIGPYRQSRLRRRDAMIIKLVAPLVALAIGCLGAATGSAQTSGPSHIMVTPDDLKWADVPSLPPGAKIAVIEGPITEAAPFTFRLKFPADYKVPAHWHPAIEHVTVISGAFNMGTGDKLDMSKSKPLSAGSVAIMQPKTNHFGWTKEETIVQVHGVGPWGLTYVNPEDDPRKK